MRDQARYEEAWDLRAKPERGRVIRYLWATPADRDDVVPHLYKVSASPEEAAEHADSFIEHPQWESQPQPKLTLLARAAFNPASPILRMPKPVISQLRMTRKGRITFSAQPDGSIVMRRG